MLGQSLTSVSIRSYAAESDRHCHDFVQLVLPLAGSLAVCVSGVEAIIGRSLGAFIDRNCPHAQAGRQANQSLVIDVDPVDIAPHVIARLTERPFLPVTPAANHLIDYMALSIAGDVAPASRVRLWTPLLLDALVGELPRPASRLSALLAMIDADPARPWTVAKMAARVGVSPSRLHALFSEELNSTPRTWLAQVRLARVREWLRTTRLPIAELAYRAGYADQSALTRAMQRATGLTPAAYRREQESKTN